MSIGFSGSYSDMFGNDTQKFSPPIKESMDQTNGGVEKDLNLEQGNDLHEQKDQLNLVTKIKNHHQELLADNLPRLSQRIEKILSSNYRYFAPAEGNLKSAVPDGKVFYVTSCFAKEGKSTAAVSLAYSLAVFSNRKVLLVDAHFTDPVLHLLFHVQSSVSFRDILLDNSNLIQGILPTFYENLFILPNISEKHYDLGITIESLKRFIKKVYSEFDYIIFDGRSFFAASETVFFSSAVDGVIFVVECERTKWEILQSAVEKVINIKAKVAGVVLNKRKFYIPPAVYKIL